MSDISANEKIPTIIVCIDTTNASQTALRYACYKAKNRGFAVQILAVMEASHKNLLFASRAIGNEKRQQLEKHLQKLIESNFKETGVTPSISVREGDIVTEIIREIKATPDCAMLVFGKSHNSLSDNTVLPKISQKIGNKINIPVTIVPENLSNEFLVKLV
ncbi:MAG: universal stress protein [Rickettsiales bacterium]|nr:universal stress protein [Rickettsiales bacterium]